jgi:magnesium transporter
MSEYFTQKDASGFEWIDVFNPEPSEIEALAAKYSLHSTSVQDCLDPEHLPKYEAFDNVKFMIFRAYDDLATPEADTVEELTRKIAIFYSDKFLITVHRTPQALITRVLERWDLLIKKSKGSVGPLLLSTLLKEICSTYEKPIDNALNKLETFEMGVFEASGAKAFRFHDGYFIKRQAFVYKRILRYSHDVMTKLNTSDPKSNPYLQDLRETVDSLLFYAEELLEGVNGLLNLHISISTQKTNEASHRTNEIVRTLTIVSVIIMPLNFIASIYGMNFRNMPELESTWGYPITLGVMAIIGGALLYWVRKRGWL